MTGGSHHAVAVKTRLSNDEFLHEHVLKQQPVVIRDALTSWRATGWTRDYLKSRAGAHLITYRTQDKDASGPFGDLLDRVFESDKPAPYLRNIDVRTQLPMLVGDITPEPVYTTTNWRSHRLMPSRWPHEVRKHLSELFVSQARASFPFLHLDYWGMSAFFAQLHGEKEVILFPREDAPYLYPKPENALVSTIADFDHPDYAAYPKLQQARQYRVTLRAGDLLFNPSWWHTTNSLSTSMTLIWAYWNRHEWRNLVAHARASVGLRGRMTLVPYLSFVGLCNQWA